MTKADRIREAWRAQQESKTETERQQQAEDASRSTEELFRGTADKVRENRLRRMAERQGLRLEKSRRRDPRAVDYGTYMLVDAASNTIVAGNTNTGYGLDLDSIEEQLTR